MANQKTAATASLIYPWTVCTLGALLFCYGFFQRVAPSVMIEDLMRDFSVTGALLGNLTAFYFYAYAGIQLPVGVMVDRWGPRLMLTLAAAACGIGSLLFAYAEALPPAYLGRFLVGAGTGFSWVCTVKLATIWFPPHRLAVVSGWVQLLGMAGGIGAQAPLAAAVALVGWRPTMAAAAVFAWALALAIWFVVREDDKAASPSPNAPKHGLLAGLGRVVRTPQSWIAAAFGAGMVLPVASFAGLWGVPYMMQAYGLERPAAAGSMSLILAGWGIGGMGLGWLSDRLRRRRLPMICGAACTLSIFVIVVYVPGLPLATVQALFFAYGLAAGVFPLGFIVSREHNPSEFAGTAVAFVNATLMTCAALSQPLIGWILDFNWDGTMVAGARIYSTDAFETAFLVVAASLTLAVAAALLVRETHARPVG